MFIMSWKRIFKLANKAKAPIIITNEDGKKPQVILPFDMYEDLLTENEFVWQGVEKFNNARDSDNIIDSNDVFDISKTDFDNKNNEMNKIETYHQYKKQKDKDYGYVSYDDLESEIENKKSSKSKMVEPDATAEAAFEPMINDAEHTIAIKTIDEPWPSPEQESKDQINLESEAKKSFSKSSEEMTMEDKFYFEPLEDEIRDR